MNLHHSLRLILCVVSLTALSACVLPIPHQSVNRQGLTGRVIDEKTSAPVAGATVRLGYPSMEPDVDVVTVITDSHGCFVVPSRYSQHWGVFVGIALNHSLPKTGPRIVPEVQKLEVEHPGYLPLRKQFTPAHMSPTLDSPTETRRRPLSGDTYRLTPRDHTPGV